MNFLIRFVNYHQKHPSRCFNDFARSLALALGKLGHEAVIEHEVRPAAARAQPDASVPRVQPAASRLILFGLHDTRPDFDVPGDAIIYNTEQVLAGTHWKNLEAYKDNPIWDYSRVHVQWFRARGASRVVHCPVGYVEGMETISVGLEDIDVLFYGTPSPPRHEVMTKLAMSGLRVKWVVGLYGADLDRLIARSKVILNLHFYDSPVFEIFRVSHLLANGRCVVSEAGGRDPELEALAGRATVCVPRGELVEACRELAGDPARRREVAERGAREFQALDFVESARRALIQS